MPSSYKAKIDAYIERSASSVIRSRGKGLWRNVHISGIQETIKNTIQSSPAAMAKGIRRIYSEGAEQNPG